MHERGGVPQLDIYPQTHLPQIFSFSSDFEPLSLKMLENTKNTLKKKDSEISKFLGVDPPPPPGFQKCGIVSDPRAPPPPRRRRP